MTDSDSASIRAFKPRGGRPAPLGPRLRQQSSFGNLLSLDGAASTSNRDSTISSNSRESTSTLYSPPPSSPGLPTSSARNSAGPPEFEQKLTVITESPVQPDSSQSVQSGSTNDTPANSAFIAVPAPITSVPTSTAATESPTPSPVPSSAPSPVNSTPPPASSPRTRVVSKQTTLLPPPQIKFEPMQIQWKGLPLEAALWTFDSQELQHIVSRAIRSSAQESFVRLLSLKQLDEELPNELERLKNLKATTQAKYRFNAQRRSMLLQALMSYSETNGNGDKDGGGPTVGRLASQLSETTIECDKLSQELVGIMDQMGQVQRLLDVHWASALAIALRKLNGSYGKRTADLQEARQKITQLEGELEDAWKEAEKMAQEIDDINAMDSDSDDEDNEDISRVVIQKAEVISVPQARPVYMASPPTEPRSLDKEMESLIPLPGSAVGSQFPMSPTDDDDDALSIHSKKSAKSYKSHRSFGGQSRVSVVSAARKRSLRTSMGSLRLPVRLFNPHDNPPVPAIPKHLSPVGTASPRDPPLSSHPLQNLKSRNASDVSIVDETLTPAQFQTAHESTSQPARRTSIDELSIEPSSVPQLPGYYRQLPLPGRNKPTSVMDDLYLPRTGSTIGHGDEDTGIGGSVGLALGGLGVSGSGFGGASGSLVPARKRRGSMDEQSIIANARRMGKDRQAQSIPSIWMNADATPTSHTSRSSRVPSPVSNDPSAIASGRVFSPEPKKLPTVNTSTTTTTIITEDSILSPVRFNPDSGEEGSGSSYAYSATSPTGTSAISTPISQSSSPSTSRSPLSRSNSKSARDRLKTLSKRISISGMGFSFQIPGHGKGGKDATFDSRNGQAPIEEGDAEGEDMEEAMNNWEQEMGFKPRSSSRPSTSRSTPIGRSGSVAKRSMKSKGSISTTSFLSLK
ncbi:hypothetical protein VKT23_018615 [Stygiomarasmius scandens]|uniref:Karyogamy protein n=1 Tax=Marasmiellus scandens TaxID=2682957 RepID=A0ABR1ISX7_9AGAR